MKQEWQEWAQEMQESLESVPVRLVLGLALVLGSVLELVLALGLGLLLLGSSLVSLTQRLAPGFKTRASRIIPPR